MEQNIVNLEEEITDKTIPTPMINKKYQMVITTFTKILHRVALCQYCALNKQDKMEMNQTLIPVEIYSGNSYIIGEGHLYNFDN